MLHQGETQMMKMKDPGLTSYLRHRSSHGADVGQDKRQEHGEEAGGT